MCWVEVGERGERRQACSNEGDREQGEERDGSRERELGINLV